MLEIVNEKRGLLILAGALSEPQHPEILENYTARYENVSFPYDDQDAATRVDALSQLSFVANENLCRLLWWQQQSASWSMKI